MQHHVRRTKGGTHRRWDQHRAEGEESQRANAVQPGPAIERPMQHQGGGERSRDIRDIREQHPGETPLRPVGDEVGERADQDVPDPVASRGGQQRCSQDRVGREKYGGADLRILHQCAGLVAEQDDRSEQAAAQDARGTIPASATAASRGRCSVMKVLVAHSFQRAPSRTGWSRLAPAPNNTQRLPGGYRPSNQRVRQVHAVRSRAGLISGRNDSVPDPWMVFPLTID